MSGTFFRSEKGSTMVMAVMMLVVLSILGTAIIGLAFSGYRMRKLDTDKKTALYLSESGLDEVYAYLGEEIGNAVAAGNSNVDSNLDGFLDAERQKVLGIPSEPSQYVNQDGTLNMEYVNRKANYFFVQGYVGYMNSSLVASGPDSQLNGFVPSGILDGAGVPEIELLNWQNFGNVFIGGSELDENWVNSRFTIQVKSSFDVDGIKKETETVFSIKIPEYGSIYYLKYSVPASTAVNALLKKALTCEENIYVTGNSVRVDGDVFAYGTIPADPRKVENYGGLVTGVNGKSGSVTINGNVYTNSNVHTNADNSSIVVNNGNIFCNGLVVQKLTDNSSIEVYNGKVLTRDDIQLNGIKSRIDIYGSYYGFSNGEAFNTSSCIIINSPDVGEVDGMGNLTGSRLMITGGDGINSETMIAGTAYVNFATPGPYQTGESISVRGNYMAYGRKLAVDDELESDQNGEFLPDNISNSDYYPGDGYEPFNLAEEFIKKLVDGVAKENVKLMGADKSRFMYHYNRQHTALDDAYRLYSGGAKGIVLNTDIIRSEGVYFGNDAFCERMPNQDVEGLRRSYEKNFKWQINTFGDEDYSTLLDDDSDDGELDSREYIRNYSGHTGRFDFDPDGDGNPENNNMVMCDGSVGNDSYSEFYASNDVVLVQNSTDIALVGPEGDVPDGFTGKRVYIADGRVSGIIVTGGNVYLSGNVELTGVVISEKSVYFESDNQKLIYSESYVTDKMKALPGLAGRFVNNDSPLVSTEVGSDGTGSYAGYANLINVASWKNGG